MSILQEKNYLYDKCPEMELLGQRAIRIDQKKFFFASFIGIEKDKMTFTVYVEREFRNNLITLFKTRE